MIRVYSEFSLFSRIETFVFKGQQSRLYMLSGIFHAVGVPHMWLGKTICVNVDVADSQEFIDFLAEVWEDSGEGMLENHTDYFRTPLIVDVPEEEEVVVQPSLKNKLAGIPRKVLNALF